MLFLILRQPKTQEMKRKFIIGALLFSAFAFGACSGSVEVEDNTDSTESTENNETNVQADTDEERDS